MISTFSVWECLDKSELEGAILLAHSEEDCREYLGKNRMKKFSKKIRRVPEKELKKMRIYSLEDTSERGTRVLQLVGEHVTTAGNHMPSVLAYISESY